MRAETNSPPESTSPVALESSTASGDGFDWGDAGIGAAGALALAAIAGDYSASAGARDHRPARTLNGAARAGELTH
jgi:hypothetical protein